MWYTAPWEFFRFESLIRIGSEQLRLLLCGAAAARAGPARCARRASWA